MCGYAITACLAVSSRRKCTATLVKIGAEPSLFSHGARVLGRYDALHCSIIFYWSDVVHSAILLALKILIYVFAYL